MFEETIDTVFIKKDLGYCSGYAQSLTIPELPRTLAEFDNCAVAATYFRRAAEHALLLSTIENSEKYMLLARDLFTKSAMQYKNWGSPYALLLAFLSDDQYYIRSLNSYFAEYWDKNEEIRIKPAKTVQYIYVLMADLGDSYLSKQIREWLNPFLYQQVGILGLSVKQILNLVDAINREESIQETIAPVLLAYDETLQIAAQNRFHFRRLLMGFHPANVELIGLLLQLYKRFNSTVYSFIETSSISGTAKLFLIRSIQNITRPDMLRNEFRGL